MSTAMGRSIVEDRIERLSDENGYDTHESMARLVFYLSTGKGYEDLEPEDLIDGHGEYQIDVLHIDEASSESTVIVTVLQVTYSESLSSTRLVKLHAGLDYLLRQPKAEFERLSNVALRDRIQEFREIRSEYMPANIKLQCYYANLLDPQPEVSGEFNEQVSRIRRDYGNDVGEFVFEPLGPRRLFQMMDERERQGTKVDDRIQIVYDQNQANLIEHSTDSVSGVVCTVAAKEIARIVKEHPTVFDENLRRFRGTGSAVNKAIVDTCTSRENAKLFWFLNNGITIVCDDYDVNKDYDDPFVKVTNLQIVNGCQTSTALSNALDKETLVDGTKVLLRILKTESPDLATNLVVTTNTQNKITSRELKAKDEIQYAIQSAIDRKFGIKYERTPNEFARVKTKPKPETVSNEKVGQAYLAIALKRPGDARARLYKIWGDDYERVFKPSVSPETYVLCYMVVSACKELKRTEYNSIAKDDLKRSILANGVMHLSRISCFYWRGTDSFTDRTETEKQVKAIRDDSSVLTPYFKKAIKLLARIMSTDSQYAKEPSVALKSSRLDGDIDRELYKPKKKSKAAKSET